MNKAHQNSQNTSNLSLYRVPVDNGRQQQPKSIGQRAQKSIFNPVFQTSRSSFQKQQDDEFGEFESVPFGQSTTNRPGTQVEEAFDMNEDSILRRSESSTRQIESERIHSCSEYSTPNSTPQRKSSRVKLQRKLPNLGPVYNLRKPKRKPKKAPTCEQLLEILRMQQAQSYSNAKIVICKKSAQADLALISEPLPVPKDGEVQFLHMFDSRWIPGNISDQDLHEYLRKANASFQETYRKSSSEDPRIVKLTDLYQEIFALETQNSTCLDEILMSILHFCHYSAQDALKLANSSFELIADKLITSEANCVHEKS